MGKEAAERLKAELASCGLTLKQWYNEVYMVSLHWKELRAEAFSRYGRKCNRCPSTLHLQVHHQKYWSIYDVTTDDLEILCGKCHQAHHDKPRTAKKKKKKGGCKSRKVQQPKKKKKLTISEFRATFNVEREIERLSREFASHAFPEAKAIRHILKTRGWYMKATMRRALRQRRTRIESSNHPMVSACAELEAAFAAYTSGPF